MADISVLLAGETWITYAVHQKGFNAFSTGIYEEGQRPLVDALERKGIEVTHIKNHDAGRDFPDDMSGIEKYDVVLLSDIGSDTLLLHPDTFVNSTRTPDRLRLIRDYVKNGGGFAMIGGYLSFQGYGGYAHYHFTPIEEILPIEMYGFDDRVEAPSGFNPQVVKVHEITKNLPQTWPRLLGYNKVKPTGQILVQAEGDDPLIVVGEYENGRTAAFASDCSPHWASPEFLEWEYYGEVWFRLIRWLSKR